MDSTASSGPFPHEIESTCGGTGTGTDTGTGTGSAEPSLPFPSTPAAQTHVHAVHTPTTQAGITGNVSNIPHSIPKPGNRSGTTTSNVWEHFSKLLFTNRDDQKASCNYCEEVYEAEKAAELCSIVKKTLTTLFEHYSLASGIPNEEPSVGSQSNVVVEENADSRDMAGYLRAKYKRKRDCKMEETTNTLSLCFIVVELMYTDVFCHGLLYCC
ncbi:putative Zinc finger, BED-type [Corchorus olitorius]|uniref:Zinc finger, BED-type n=1 Tax=Corchorus olitorius TaxID=93759 RepID=A0A1R3FWT3_9ROSI|nr:putative Zinc finger, BED-type [Corchorus olitorius]